MSQKEEGFPSFISGRSGFLSPVLHSACVLSVLSQAPRTQERHSEHQGSSSCGGPGAHDSRKGSHPEGCLAESGKEGTRTTERVLVTMEGRFPQSHNI